jgi:AcrR family transcriptional regulator
MPYTANPADRVDDLALAAVRLISAEGVAALTVRRLAADGRVSPSALINHFENKQRILRLVTQRIGDRLVRATRDSVRRRGSAGVLPDQDTLPWVRAWLALGEIGRSDTAIGQVVVGWEEEIQYEVAEAFHLSSDDVVTGQTLHALVIGLWTQMCAEPTPMPADHADTILRHLCSRIGVTFAAGWVG